MHIGVEARVDLSDSSKQNVFAEPMREDVDVREVSCASPMDPLRGPASMAGCGLQGVAGGTNVLPLRRGLA